MIVGFTGSQFGMTIEQQAKFVKLIAFINPQQFHHGMCIGADEQAERLVRENCPQAIVHGHPPKYKTKKSKRSKPDVLYSEDEYLVRNHNIVDRCQILVATPAGIKEQVRSGTWATIRYARKLQKQIELIFPNE